MDSNDDLIIRMGTFFMVMGGGVFLLFVTSDIADKANFDYFFISLILTALGWFFRRKKPAPPPAGRFEAFKKWRETSKSKKSGKTKEK